MGKITFDYSKTAGFISEEEIGYMSRLTEQAKDVLVSKNGAGNDFLGWIDLTKDQRRRRLFPFPCGRQKNFYGTGGEYADPVQSRFHDRHGI